MNKIKSVIKKQIASASVGAFCLLAFSSYGQTLNNGFKLIEKRFVKEVNADCYFFEHVKSGAHLIKVAAKDDNKTFGITFKTLPNSDNGVAHILEHSVLNGSKNFPVKSPFDVLSKGSLNTFLNATTSRDATAYPFASMNEKDYFNLMYVYLDAVFNPNIYTDPRILMQEGWHYELTNKDSAIIAKGVVYNEMKGALSNPQRELLYHNMKAVFPDNVYGCESGGMPNSIITLTQEQFVDFHKKYYHPDNSIIFLYGDADMNKELEFIDKNYLSKYTKSGNTITIPEQKPFTAMKTVSEYYPVLEGTPTEDQTFLCLNYAAGKGSDYSLILALDIIGELVFNQESAPVRLALQEAGIGQDVWGGSQSMNQNLFLVQVQNANAKDKEKFKEIVYNTLKDVVKKGIDKDEIKGIINRIEFQLKEGSDAQKGISYMDAVKSGWFYAKDPFSGLEYEKQLVDIKKALTTNYLEQLIEKLIINNNHCALVSFEPKPGLEKERNIAFEKQMADYKAKLTPAQLDNLIKSTNDLIEYQKTEDTPEALAKMPMLSLSDINPKPTFYACEEKVAEGNKCLFHEEFTGGIIYTNMYFNLKALPVELIPYASLLSDLYTMMNTQKYTYGDLTKEMNIHLGSFGTSVSSFLEDNDDDKLLPMFIVSSKMMNNKTDKMFEMASEILLKSNFADTTRLRDVLTRQKAQLEASMKRNGIQIASRRLSSYYNNEGVYNEMIRGLEYYWFISDLVENFNTNSTQIVANLNKTAKLIFAKDNMITGITSDKKDYEVFTKGLASFANNMSASKTQLNTWKFNFEKKNEGILTASKVQFVVAGANFKKLGLQWNGNLRVLNQIISTDYLHTNIRVLGGAYGGFSSFGTNGSVSFSSYRDPNLQSTIDAYNGIPAYLSKFEADEKTMTRYIIGTISDMDSPSTAEQKGVKSFAIYFSKRTYDMMLKDRTSILSTKAADIRAYEKFVQTILDNKAICVYGNTNKIQAEKSSLNQLIKIEK